MAAIRLWREVIGDDTLPYVCMRCGDPAAERKTVVFWWSPPALKLLFFLVLFPPAVPVVLVGYPILWLVCTKRMTVQVPLCARHRSHWSGRVAVMLGSFVGLGLLVWLVMTWLFNGEHHVGRNDAFFYMVGIPVVAILIWVILVFVLVRTTMGAVEMTDEYLTISGVSPKFVAAVCELMASISRTRLRMIDDAEAGRRGGARADDPGITDRPPERFDQPPPDAYEGRKDDW